ncbi:MAG: hypothetical protein Q9170_006780 [Blastenia crenularia]
MSISCAILCLHIPISVITLAVILSYFPQYQRIITRNSSNGISPYYILLSQAFTTSALANILLLRSTDGGYTCCKNSDLHGPQCFTALAGTVQAALQFLGSVILLIIYLIFYPRPPLDLPPQKHPKRHSLSKSDLALSPDRRRALSSQPYPRLPKFITISVILLIAVILIPTLSIIFSPNIASHRPASLLQGWSFFTATFALLAATVQFLPQLYTTLRLKRHASLSLVMLALQCPVYIVLGVSKSKDTSRVPHDEGRRSWTRLLQNGEIEWTAYVVTGTMEALLLGLSLYLWWRRSKSGILIRDLDGDDVVEGEGDEIDEEGEEYITGVSASEETPLLPGRRENELQGSRRWRREAVGR